VVEAHLSPSRDEEFLEDPPAPGPYEPGDLICRKYRLIEPIGFGGMGAVWRAHNEVLDVAVALKLIRSDARGSGSAERLLIEARAAAGLHHAAVVQVFDFGKTRYGDPFIVMDLLRGKSLRDLLDESGRMSPVEAVRHLLPILAGVGCAHARGIVHRDLKPENIFFARDDAGRVQPKVLDFGIAKLEGTVSRLTTGGILLGSPEYMSPEQAMGEDDIDHRVDVWAAAVVLYEMIAGRTPWESSNCPALLRAIVDDPPKSLGGTNEVDARLWAILERGLAKNRDKRWATMRNFGRALAGWLASRGVPDDVTGASLKATWLAPDPRPTPRDSHPAVAIETLAEQKRISDFLHAPWLRKKWTLGITAPIAAALALLGVAYRSSPAPAAASPAAALVAPRDVTPFAASVQLAAVGVTTASPDAAVSEVDLDVLDREALPRLPTSSAGGSRAPAVERARAPSPAVSGTKRSKASALAAPIAQKSAKSMDFGF
jgi:serine/threonine-protein kinase